MFGWLLANLLRRRHFEITFAGSGYEALARLAALLSYPTTRDWIRYGFGLRDDHMVIGTVTSDQVNVRLRRGGDPWRDKSSVSMMNPTLTGNIVQRTPERFTFSYSLHSNVGFNVTMATVFGVIALTIIGFGVSTWLGGDAHLGETLLVAGSFFLGVDFILLTLPSLRAHDNERALEAVILGELRAFFQVAAGQS